MSQIFSFQDHPVRTITENGQFFFVGSDIAKLLGYARPDKEVRRICKHVKLFKPTKLVGLGNSPRGFLIIPESDVWRLIVQSTLPKAQEIEEWIMSEVLPTIRKTGSFGKPKLKQACLPSPEPYLPLAQDLLDSLTREIDARLSECLSLYIQVEDLIAAATPTLSMHLGPTRLALASSLRRGSVSYLDSVRCGLEGLRYTCKALSCYQA